MASAITQKYLGVQELHVMDTNSGATNGGVFLHDNANAEYTAQLAVPTLSGDVVLTLPSATGTLATTDGTLASPTLTSPTISGTVAGGASYTAPTITSPTISGTVAGSASYTAPTVTSPTISGTVGGSASYTSPTLTGPTFSGTVTRDTQWFLVNGRAKVGATAGWVVGAGDNLGLMATLPQNQSGSTLVVPIDGLHTGDIITGFGINCQIESASNGVTVDLDLRKMTVADGDYTDASISTLTQISVTADASRNGQTTGTKESISEAVASGVIYYFLVTATTGGTTDIALGGLTLKINQR